MGSDRDGYERYDDAVVDDGIDHDGAATDFDDPFDKELDLSDDDSLPWLESADDDYGAGQSDTARVVGIALAGIAVIALLAVAIWFLTSRDPDPEMIADGGTIEAPDEPFKIRPENPGGSEVAGTNDISPVQGEGGEVEGRIAERDANAAPGIDLAQGSAAPNPTIAGAIAALTGDAPRGASRMVELGSGSNSGSDAAGASESVSGDRETAAGGVGVQVGAFSSRDRAESAWRTLAGRSQALSGMRYRIVEGRADMGTVFRLQAVPGGESEAQSLCTRLRGEGIDCQVKR